MVSKHFFDISTSFRFSENQFECPVHSWSSSLYWTSRHTFLINNSITLNRTKTYPTHTIVHWLCCMVSRLYTVLQKNKCTHTVRKPKIWTGQDRSQIFWYVVLMLERLNFALLASHIKKILNLFCPVIFLDFRTVRLFKKSVTKDTYFNNLPG